MGQIKINNIIYGTTSASDIIYKNTTVEEKLDTIPVFDINDNSNVSPSSDYLTYGHIIDNLNSSATDKVLSANQGRVLKESIENIDFSPLEAAINNIKDSYIKNTTEGAMLGLHLTNSGNVHSAPYLYTHDDLNVNFRYKETESGDFKYTNIKRLDNKLGFIDYANPLVYNQKLNYTSSSSVTPPVNTYTAPSACQAIISLQIEANSIYKIKIAINGKNIINDVIFNHLQSYTVVPLFLKAGDVLTMSILTNMSTSNYSIFPMV